MGFIPLRQAGDKTKRAIDLIGVVNRNQSEAPLLSLDAEKAFNRLGWPFMFAALPLCWYQGPLSASHYTFVFYSLGAS